MMSYIVYYTAEWMLNISLGWWITHFSYITVFTHFRQIGQWEKIRISTTGKHFVPFNKKLFLIWNWRKRGAWQLLVYLTLKLLWIHYLLIGSLIWLIEHLHCPDPVVVTQLVRIVEPDSSSIWIRESVENTRKPQNSICILLWTFFFSVLLFLLPFGLFPLLRLSIPALLFPISGLKRWDGDLLREDWFMWNYFPPSSLSLITVSDNPLLQNFEKKRAIDWLGLFISHFIW